jgi:hypothetical protein
MSFQAGANCGLSAIEMMVITIAQKNPYPSPLHDKVCEEILHAWMK